MRERYVMKVAKAKMDPEAMMDSNEFSKKLMA
jgi:hypothetical protein